MPLREGSVVRLVQEKSIPDYTQFCYDVLQHSLSALDYLANSNVCHRDVKPDNILYYELPGKGGYHFQLADFGLAHHHSLAKTFCGTGYYQAPELWPQVSHIHAAQSSKMDVFSLCATIIAVDCRFRGFPPHTRDYSVVLSAVRSKASNTAFEPMARLHPEDRASAAQMLATYFKGRGLTTPRWKIPPIKPDETPQEATLPSIETITPPQTKLRGGKTRPQQEKPSRPLIVYPPRGPQRSPAHPIQPIRTHREGIAKRRAGSRRAGVDARAGILLEQGRVKPEDPSRKAHKIPGAFDSST